ncbi:hypothetical protein JOM56_002266 [Amanita muscaria]
MRKTSWAITFVSVAVLLTLVRLCASERLIVRSTDASHTKTRIYYGLMEHCQLADNQNNSNWYTIYECRKFPTSLFDGCEKENRTFCATWVTAGYAAELSAGFAALTTLTILFGVSSRARRRRMWRAVAGLLSLHVLLQIITFGVVTVAFFQTHYPRFERAQFGLSYVFSMLTWVIGILTVAGVVVTGRSAEKGNRWAAGNRAYHTFD